MGEGDLAPLSAVPSPFLLAPNWTLVRGSIKPTLSLVFYDSPQSSQGVLRIGVGLVRKLLGPTAGFTFDVSKAALGDAITDSPAVAVKRLAPFQSYIGMRQALDLLTSDY